jgi:methylated-DNA-protein-cysteine methyltransferase-like protein
MIPSGRVTTYGAIAATLGGKQGARTVGWALNSTLHQPEFLPAHRVVNRSGLLTGKRYFSGNSMIELLQSEGVVIDNNKIKDIQKYFWDPAKELSL